MKINFKIFVITIFLLVFSFSYVNAIDMFLTYNSIDVNSSETITNTITENDENINETISNESSTIVNPAPTITHSSSSTDNTLTISDIIDIILIAVCIVLIFLGIAILIRCK